MLITVPVLASLPKLKHGFFTRQGGVSTGVHASLNVSRSNGDSPKAVQENRRRAARALGYGEGGLLTVTQDHTNTALSVNAPFSPRETPPVADALVTRTPGLLLGIMTADCAPILLVDPEARVISACHAGSKGALVGIVEATVEAMESAGARPSRILAAIGPCIGTASYEVGDDFRAPFLKKDEASARFFTRATDAGPWHFDLNGFVEDRLNAMNVGEVIRLDRDTFQEQDLFFSYRHATLHSGGVCGRQLSAIALEP
ncbi:peptidoglycan editing factor PgeF [Phaeovibrio sulfidiphilus]|uniref:Purine nucleoside phosphorylase n=1 Tax=Phaeovibrio sulfidiphilus TaxID=1220600 RepID=A0A8J6YUP3_9PROT|nr:peptidoglycan editing factor PgeF [Phaeovibrio sulfidiphilus]MBE1236087.1 peptidoglycan editing factor PgeF [Phaeovibrio sulfidiphilus]